MSARIEFCGVPASGKSALCGAAAGLLRQRGCAVLDRGALVESGLRGREFGAVGNILGAISARWRREFLGLPHALADWHRFAVDHPAFVALVHGWLAEEPEDAAWRAAVLHAVLESVFEFELARVAENPALLDEGFAQRFFSLRGYRDRGRPEDAGRYAAAFPAPAGLVLVTAPAEVCLHRAGQRDHLPVLLRETAPAALAARFARGNALLEGLAAEVERHGIPVLRCDGAGELRSEAARVADFVESVR